MISNNILIASSLFVFATIINALQILDTQSLTSPSPDSITNPLLTSNNTFLNTSTSLNASLDVQCNGATYGMRPNIADCEDAKHKINPDSEQLEYGERHTGLTGEIVQLPLMVFGSKNNTDSSIRGYRGFLTVLELISMLCR